MFTKELAWRNPVMAIWRSGTLGPILPSLALSVSTLGATFILSMDGRHLCRINFGPDCFFSLELQGTSITLCCWIGQWLVMLESPCVTKILEWTHFDFCFFFWMILNFFIELYQIVNSFQVISTSVSFKVLIQHICLFAALDQSLV